MWSYKEWVGSLYPLKAQPREFLDLYSHRFTTVEGNTTFYAIPSIEIVDKWVNQTPKGFKFCPKMHRQITHQGLLVPRLANANNFLDIVARLGDRLGITFIQLPPSYSPQYLPDLTEFLTTLKSSGLRLALEVRHPDWFQSKYYNQLNSLLTDLDIAKVLLDTRPIYNCPGDPQRHSPRKKPKLPVTPVVIGNTAFVRFITHPEQQYNQNYLKQWATKVSSWLDSGMTVYFFVHCPQEERSPNTAKQFYRQLQQLHPNLNSLPWDSCPAHPTQLSLF